MRPGGCRTCGSMAMVNPKVNDRSQLRPSDHAGRIAAFRHPSGERMSRHLNRWLAARHHRLPSLAPAGRREATRGASLYRMEEANRPMRLMPRKSDGLHRSPLHSIGPLLRRVDGRHRDAACWR
jgi:hypothetical protein